MNTFCKLFQRLLIYGAILMVILPASLALMLVSAPKAKAAETPAKTKKVEVKKTTKALPVAGSPKLITSKGLAETYYPNDKIKIVFLFEGKVLNSWAEVGWLDGSFPQTINLTNQGDGGWRLVTPKLTNNLNLGAQTIRVFAANEAGTSVFSFNLVLSQKTAKITPKTIVEENEIRLAWQPIKAAQKYLISWNIQGDRVFHLRVVEQPKTTLENLTPGTIYEIEITPIDQNGVLSEPQKMSFRTQGTAPAKVLTTVSGIQTGKITPSIGTGVSTAAPSVVQKPAVETPTPQSSAKPAEEEKTGGWNRLLVALAILIIAAGAAIGGYYGYEWFAGRSHQEPPDEKSSSRW